MLSTMRYDLLYIDLLLAHHLERVRRIDYLQAGHLQIQNTKISDQVHTIIFPNLVLITPPVDIF